LRAGLVSKVHKTRKGLRVFFCRRP